MKYIDESGKKYGKLEVIEYFPCENKQATFLCKCECGKETKVRGVMLRTGKTKSCGCLRHETPPSWTGYGEISGRYFGGLKAGAINRGQEFLISIQEAWEIFLKQNRKCALSGQSLIFVKNYNIDCQLQTASLDRIDSTKGYILNNIQWIHKKINELKRNWSDKELIKWCHLISNNNKNINEYYLHIS